MTRARAVRALQRSRRWAPLLLAALLSLGLSGAHSAAGFQDDGLQPTQEVPLEGFWPTRLMIERFLDRAVDEMTEQYTFDEEQRARTRDLLGERVPEWMNANRAEMQTLMNRFIEAQMHDEPPSPADVAQWAQRVQPLLVEFEDVFTGVTESMREYLRDEQITLLDAEFAAFQAGVGLVKNKVAVWADGGYDPETEWTAPGEDRRRREREERNEMRAAMDTARDEVVLAPTDPSGPAADVPGAESSESQPVDEWALYTQRFVQRYDLNRDQRQKANAFLLSKQEERDKYLQQKSRELERVTQMAFAAQSDEARAKARAAFDKLNEPIDRVFSQLKEKLETLPTRAQRRGAEIRESRQPASQPAPSPASNPG